MKIEDRIRELQEFALSLDLDVKKIELSGQDLQTLIINNPFSNPMVITTYPPKLKPCMFMGIEIEEKRNPSVLDKELHKYLLAYKKAREEYLGNHGEETV